MYKSCKRTTDVPSVKAATKTAASAPILMEGYLMKQKHGKCKAWLKRYFILYKDEVRYYKTKNDTNALAVISLAHYSLEPDAQPLATLNQKQWKKHTFALISDDEQKFDWPDYYLQAANAKERQLWIDILQEDMSKQSYSVLDKWLERLQLPLATTSNTTRLASLPNSSFVSTEKISPLISSSTLTPAPHTIPHPPLSAKSATFSYEKDAIPHLYKTYSDNHSDNEQRFVRFYKSTETLNTYRTQTTTVTNTMASSRFSRFRRRPSESLARSRSIDLSSDTTGLTTRLFNWSSYSTRTPYRSQSSSTSVESSLTESIDYMNQFSSSCHVIAEAAEISTEQHPVELDTASTPCDIKQPSEDVTARYYYYN